MVPMIHIKTRGVYIAIMIINGQNRKDIYIGLEVEIILKKDQSTGKTTRGIVKDILTNSQNHPHGIKVRLQNGQIGRVQTIIGNKNSHT